MSASLVGSEMCIRDSQGPVQELRVLAIRSHAELREVASTTALEHDVEAVSYTHLTLPTICSV
eukprot:12204895-Alexandrium_andersonii.AAC.1